MGKRSAIISVIILISGLAILGYYLQQGRRNLLTDPYKAISPTAGIIIATIDLQSFLNSLTTGRGLFGEAGKIKEFETFNRKIKFLADQMNKPAYKNILDGSKAVISFHHVRKRKSSDPSFTGCIIRSEAQTDQGDSPVSGIKTINETKHAWE